MSPTRAELVKWLAQKEARGKTLDIGGNIWSMKGKVRYFEGEYETLCESEHDLNHVVISKYALPHYEYFDNVFCTEVMQFVYDPLLVLLNIRDLMKRRGKLYLSFHLTHPPMKGHDYLRYTEKGIRKLLESAEFKIDEFLEPLPGYFLVECSRL